MGWAIAHQLAITKMPPLAWPQDHLTWAEVPSSRVTLACVQLTKCSQHRRQVHQVFLTCVKIVYEWDLENVTLAHAVDSILASLFLHISLLRFHQRKSGFKWTVIYLFIQLYNRYLGKLDSHVPIYFPK